MRKVCIIFFSFIFFSLIPGYCCISDPSVTVIYNLSIDTELMKALKQEGFSYTTVIDAIPSFGAEGQREFIVYKAHYGLATAMVAYDILVLKAHEEKYNWEKGIKTELLFLRTAGVLLEIPDINTISKVASWESQSGKNVFRIPEGIEFVSFSSDVYPVSESVMTDYFYFLHGWIAVPGNATVSAEENTLDILIFRCGGELSADTSKLSLFAPLREVLLVANSIDYELTGRELKTILTEKGYLVRRITPAEFDVYRWFSPRIILLGGHKSPEGMGEIVSTILTETEMIMIEKTGPYLFAHEDIDFRKQSIIVFAGADREGTHEIALLRIDDIIMWLEYY